MQHHKPTEHNDVLLKIIGQKIDRSKEPYSHNYTMCNIITLIIILQY